MPASSGFRRLQAEHPFRHFPFTIVHGLESHAIRSCGAPSAHLQCCNVLALLLRQVTSDAISATVRCVLP